MSEIEPMDDATAKSESQWVGDQGWLAAWPLANGTVVRFRHVSPDDEPLITEAIRTASRATLLHRFFSPIQSVAPDLLRRMLAIDRSRELCLVGVTEGNDATRIVCGARYVRLPTPGHAEIAFTVHDDYQQRGLGIFLLKLLASLARADGVRWFEADVMASNHKMLGLFKKVVPEITRNRLGDVEHLAFEVAMVPALESSADR